MAIENLEQCCSILSRPSVMHVHHVVYQGVRYAKCHIVRNRSLEMLRTLVYDCYPPLDEQSRNYYFYAFFTEIVRPDDKKYDASKAWTNFSQCLNQVIENPDDVYTKDYLIFLVDLLETDFKNWLDE